MHILGKSMKVDDGYIGAGDSNGFDGRNFWIFPKYLPTSCNNAAKFIVPEDDKGKETVIEIYREVQFDPNNLDIINIIKWRRGSNSEWKRRGSKINGCNLDKVST